MHVLESHELCSARSLVFGQLLGDLHDLLRFLRLQRHVLVEPGADLLLAQVSVVVDVARLEHLVDVLLPDVDRRSVLRLSQGAFTDLKRHADEVEGLTAVEHAGLVLVMVVPDLVNNRIEQLRGEIRRSLVTLELLDELGGVRSLGVGLPSKDAEEDLRHLRRLHKLDDLRVLAVLVRDGRLCGESHELVKGLGVVLGRVLLVEELARQVDDVEQIVDHDDVLLGVLHVHMVVMRALLVVVVTALERGLPDAVEDELALVEGDFAAIVFDLWLLLSAASRRGKGRARVDHRVFHAHGAHPLVVRLDEVGRRAGELHRLELVDVLAGHESIVGLPAALCDEDRIGPDSGLYFAVHSHAHEEDFQRAERGRWEASRLVVILQLCQLDEMARGLIRPRLAVVQRDVAAVAVFLRDNAAYDLVIVERGDDCLDGSDDGVPVGGILCLVVARAPLMLVAF